MTESQRIRKSVCQSAGNLNSLAARVSAAKPVRTLDLNRFAAASLVQRAPLNALTIPDPPG